MYINLSFIVQVLLLILGLNIFILFSSCENKSVSSFEEDIKDLITWSNSEENFVNINQQSLPISSSTLAEIVYLEYFNIEEDIVNIKSDKGIVIGVINFTNNKLNFTNKDTDLLILISRSQKYEKFNILIEANNIKFKISGLLDRIEKILISNGVSKDNISIRNINEDDLIIKIIKTL